MEIKNIERKDGKVSFEVTVDAARFEDEVNKAYLRNRGRIMISGFRKGHAPRKIIESMYGAEVFHSDAVDAIALECWRAGMEEAKDRTVGDPAITDYKVNEDKSLTISFETVLYPEVTLGQYKELTGYKAPTEVTDAQVEEELTNVRKRNARIVDVDRPAENGDTVVIDYQGLLDGVPFDGGTAKEQKLKLGSGAFVPGFEDQLIGVQAGQERELDITFPEGYTPELAGKASVFKVKVHKVQEEQLPEADDEFAQDVSEFDTLADYRESIRKDLEEKAEERSKGGFRSELLRKAVENASMTLPDVMVASRVSALMDEYARSIQQQGYTVEQYLGMMGMNVDTLRSYMRPSAESELRSELTMEKIAEVEGLTVADEEIDAEIAKLAEQYKMEVERVRSLVNNEVIRRDLLLRKAADLIVESGVAVDKPEEPEKAEEAPAEEPKAE